MILIGLVAFAEAFEDDTALFPGDMNNRGCWVGGIVELVLQSLQTLQVRSILQRTKIHSL
jgi:hypothetical protein